MKTKLETECKERTIKQRPAKVNVEKWGLEKKGERLQLQLMKTTNRGSSSRNGSEGTIKYNH